MTREKADAFARAWADDWNRRDLDRILSHFEDGVVFSTPVAVQTIGAPTVRGKAALRSYWEAALGRIESIHFEVRRILWDPEARELSIVYDRRVNGREDRATEVLGFGDSGLVVRGEVFYGVIPG